MAQNINSIKSQFDKMARPTLFKVTGLGLDGKLEFMCKSTQIPASTIGIIEVPNKGRKIKIPGDRTYAPWTMQIFNDEDFTIHRQVMAWMDTINTPEGNLGSTSSEAVKRDGFVQQLNSDGKIVAEYQFVGCWVSELGEITLDQEAVDTLEEFTLTLQYDYHAPT